VHDRVGDVLAQRAALGRGAGIGVVLSVLLHGGLIAIAVYAATHTPPTQRAQMVQIQFAPLPAMTPATRPKTATPKPAQPKIEEPKPKIAEPKPVVEKPAPKPPERNTVPLSPFGRSTKKGSEAPVVPPAPAPAAPTSTAPAVDVPIGGSGVTGLEGGDFPYTLYVQGMQRKIGGNWFRPQIAGGAAVIIYFRIQRDGTITDAKIETSSGNGTFDRAALSAVRSSSPLNTLPFAYTGSFLGVHLTFR
jgi:protein TonB